MGYENLSLSAKFPCHSRDGLGREFGQLKEQQEPLLELVEVEGEG